MGYSLIGFGALDCLLGQKPSDDGLSCVLMTPEEKEEFCLASGDGTGVYLPDTNQCELGGSTEADRWCVSTGGALTNSRACICPPGKTYESTTGKCIGTDQSAVSLTSEPGKAGVGTIAAVAGIAAAGALAIYALFG